MRKIVLAVTLFFTLACLGQLQVLPALAFSPAPENTGQCCYDVMQQLPVTVECQTLNLDRELCGNAAQDPVQALSAWQLFWKQGLSAVTIGIACLVLLGVIVLVKVFTKYRLRRADYISSVLVGAAATGASLVYHTKRFSGEGQIEQFGWPHFFYFMYYSFNVIQDQGINVGPVGSYVIMNILFYSLLTLLIVLVIRVCQRKKVRKYL